MSNARVSIIMPCYNAASYIEQTICSVQEQSYTDWELLIADDCSTDHSRDYIASFTNKDARIKLIKCHKNGGPAKARNAALKAAKGRWIAFLDSDDLWLSDKLDKSIEKARSEDAALVCTAFRRFIELDGGERKTGHLICVPNCLSYRDLLGGNKIATSTVLIDSYKSGPIQMNPIYYDDLDCWLNILKKGSRAVGLNEDLMRYRVLSGSVSRNKLRSAYHHWDTIYRVQGLSLMSASWYFFKYGVKGIIKYVRL